MIRLLLVRHAPTAETRRAAFPATPGAEPLDRAGEQQARALAPLLPPADRCWSSPAVRARQTAELTFGVAEVDPDLAECDFGSWAGSSLEDVHRLDPDGLGQWFTDPDSTPHGGESFTEVRARARRVLDRAADAGGSTLAFTHGGLVKAALLEALDLPSLAVWQLDAAPASVTELHHTHGAWRVVRLNWTPALTGPPVAAGAEGPAQEAVAP
jgi:broad specificity phosphatase PhoE